MAYHSRLDVTVRGVSVVKVRDIIEAIEDAGWVYVRTAGDHRQYAREGATNVVTIAGKPGDDMSEGTLGAICRTAGIDKSALKGRRKK